MADVHYYKGLIWTNHALERIGQRGLTQEMAYQAFNHPDKSSPGRNSGSTEYQKKFGKSIVSIIAKKNEKNEWLVLSCWIDPPLLGSIDAKKKEEYQRYRKATFWGKILLTLKRQLGF